MRAPRISLENRVGPRSRLRVDRAPARETAGQYLERQYRRRYPHEARVGFLCASGRRSLPEELTKLPMGLDERSKPGLPQDVWQASIAVQLMVAFDQALTLHCQALRQKTGIKILRLVRDNRLTCVIRHDLHRSASRCANQ